MSLIKTVRSLDQNGPGEGGENLQLLWSQLSASVDSQFHAAEESSLRWLLKLMNGASPAAETMRRYPLSWTILECIFRRMPLLSLAKSLAFRKFVAVLQQTAIDLASPKDLEATAKPGKRKRDSTITYELEHMKTTQARLQAATAVFKALHALLHRLDAVSSHDRIGAEHVRSLFCTSAAEMIKIVDPLFVVCGLVLDIEEPEELDSSEEWITIISSIWDLHLQGDGDANEVAAHLLGDVLLLVRQLELIVDHAHAFDTSRNRWISDIQSFLQKVITQPAKAAYISQRSQAIVALALQTNSIRLHKIAPALYHVLTASSISSELRRRKGEKEWIENVFNVIEEAVRNIQGRESLLKSLLQRAAEKSTPIEVEHLRFVCREYALKNETRWDILALAVACDADVFQVTDSGKDLLKMVCSKLLAESDFRGERYDSMTRVVGGILQGFRVSRDMPGFLKLWYEQMCHAEVSSSSLQSPWFYVGQSSGEHSLSASVEQYISPAQLLDVLDWVVATGVHKQALSVFLARVSEGVTSDSFADAVCNKIFEVSQLLEDSKTTSWAMALRWRTIARTLAWFPSDKRGEAWVSIHKSLSKILRKGEIESASSFEAFKCCCQAWSSMGPDDPRLSEPLALLEAFSKRLMAHISEIGLSSIPSVADSSAAAGYDLAKGPGLEHYVAWYSRGQSRLVHLSVGQKERAPLVPELATKLSGNNASVEQCAWKALVENDQVWQDISVTPEVIGRLTTSLEEVTKREALPYSGAHVWVQLLSHIPSDAFTRQQRERMMAALMSKAQRTPKAQSNASLDDWRCLLSLVHKLALRPTFYDGMCFEDLVSVSDALCQDIHRFKPEDETFLEIIERMTEIATATFRRMTENVDERSLKYLDVGSSLLSPASDQITTLGEGSVDITSLPLRLILMKCLATLLSHSTHGRDIKTLASLCKQTQETTSKLIAALIDRWVNDKKSRREHTMVFSLYAALDAAHSLGAEVDFTIFKSSKLRKLDESSYESMMEGDLRGWTIQIFLRTYLPTSVANPFPGLVPPLDNVPSKLREAIMSRMMDAVLKDSTIAQRCEFVRLQLANISDSVDGRQGQVMAIEKVVRQIISMGQAEPAENATAFPLLYGELIRCLPRITSRADANRLCRVLQQLLETSPQPLGQWNIELTLEQLCDLSSKRNESAALPFISLCKVVESVIKKHRLRLEGHYHLLITLLEALLCQLIAAANAIEHKGPKAQAALAHSYGRIITLICEPTAGAVSRGQQQGSLSSATDAAKRSAGKHMYLILMQYVKLQLEGGVARPVREALEPGMNSIFDITSPEGRKILNDAMNASGRAILREMFKRYTKFGKWSGV
ncbi:hypothetical protein NLU13_2805 [Sarocladium strictum]|uniref:Nucleolar 27S pre-rRNA processing Urb2/Npa2 C-terminal domain-containing protein n=1 Tax=Sarocladium strictum TaxID=5046 RepID=A0AA39GKU0_SARSR|nr:hypothetical protein NLU13_2805 [Sarocladium strictum]